MGRGDMFGAVQPWLTLAVVVALLVGCGGSETEPDDAAEEVAEAVDEEPDTTDEVEETVGTDAEAHDEPADEPAPEGTEDPAQTDDGEADIFALQPGDVIEGTYEFGFPESGAAFACTWLDTDQGRVTLVYRPDRRGRPAGLRDRGRGRAGGHCSVPGGRQHRC